MCLSSSRLNRLYPLRNRIQWFFHREQEAIAHVNGRCARFDFDEDYVFAIDDDLAAFVDPVQLYEWHGGETVRIPGVFSSLA